MSEKRRLQSAKTILPLAIIVGSALLTSCDSDDQSQSSARHEASSSAGPSKDTPKTLPLPKNVLGIIYTSDGQRTVTLRTGRPIVSLTVTESCNRGNLLTETNVVSVAGDLNDDGIVDYRQRNTLTTTYQSPDCSDGKITPQDNLPIPTPAPQSQPDQQPKPTPSSPGVQI